MTPAELTVYLCLSEVDDPRTVIRPQTPGDEPISWHRPTPDPGYPCLLAARVRQPRAPGWASYLAEHFAELEVPATQPVAAVLLAEVADRVFAVTFGRGHDLLRPELLEPDFGLRIVANSIDPAQIKGVRTTTVATNPRRTEQTLASPGDRSDLTVNLGGEWIRKLSGRSTETGRIIAGSLSNRMTLDEDGSDLPALAGVLEHALARYRETTYQAGFDALDRIQPLNRRDPRVTELDALLHDRVAHGTHTLLGCAVPDEFFGFGGTDVAQFEIHGDRRPSSKGPELRLTWIADRMRQCGPDPLHRLKVRCIDAAGEVVDDRELRDFLTAELTFQGSKYILLAGRWIRISDDFFREVDDEIAQLPVFGTTDLRLPPWWMKHDEGAYNRSADSPSFCVLDRKLFHQAGQRGGVEICDLLTRGLHLVCVKRLSRSSTLSHLFAQGRVSARLYAEDQAYRDTVIRHHRAHWPGKPFTPGTRPTVVFALGTTRATEPVHRLLPFFSKINLFETVRMITALRNSPRVAIATIPMTDQPPREAGPAPDSLPLQASGPWSQPGVQERLI